MPLKVTYEQKTDIPAGFDSLYTEVDGKFQLTGVEGMKTEEDITKLNNALVKERNDHKALKTKFAPLANLDVTEVLTKLDKYPELEELSKGKVDESKVETIVQQRLSQKLTPLERKLQEAEQKAQTFEQEVNLFKQIKKDDTITSAIYKAAKAAKITDEAVLDDVVKIAKFDMQLDDDSNEVTTKDGKTLSSFFTEMQNKKPHWWGATIGGGAGGSSRGSKITDNPFSNEHWNMTRQGEIFKEDPAKAEQLAKMAGTTVGGGKPKGK